MQAATFQRFLKFCRCRDTPIGHIFAHPPTTTLDPACAATIRKVTQFNAVAEQWRAAQQQMEQSLESIQHARTQASALYAETEMQASRLFAQ